MISIISDLESVLDKYNTVISFNPLPDEPKISLPDTIENISIPNDKTTDPFITAEKLIKSVSGQKVAILVPGTKFDKYGTRYGRGGGWYDRFLSKIPTDWLRIGVCFADQVSVNSLERKLHDQPIDILYMVTRSENPS